MAAKRGRTQARRSGGNGGSGGGLPGWAWLVVGVAITLLVVIAAPRLMKHDKDGFFRPTPNPDAQPRNASEEAVVDEDAMADKPAPASQAAADDGKKKQDFDFYTLLPGKEVPMTDAELAASEQAEKAEREKQDQAREAAAATATPSTPAAAPAPLPAPVDEAAIRTAAADARPATAIASPATAAAPAASPSASTADTRYILQAGAFQASGQAEELKARIALLGLGARVESAQISGKTVYRVRMGPYGTAGELADAKRKLAGGGLSAMAVRTN